MKKINSYKIIGVMSGTSLDGIDIAKCIFDKSKGWNYKIEKAVTVKYSSKWKSILNNLHLKSKKEIYDTDIKYAKLIGDEINNFLKNDKSDIDFISSHGHTIFHEPQKKVTLQIGNGQIIANTTKIKTISNFRKLDIDLGGQGAPLVPIGDYYLYKDYKYCLNIGGFANVSIKRNKNIIAFDICPANIILNYLASKADLEFDDCGKIGMAGQVDTNFLNKLNQLNYYKRRNPKSLSREWVEKEILTMPEIDILKNEDLFATLYEHIGFQIGRVLKDESTCVTGGGAKNTYLCQQIKKYSKSKIIIADKINLDFKEAMIFGFLGLLKSRDEINCLKSVTGASKNCSSGEIHLPRL
tara:strand:- start:6883 stop:7944 length:1062 start_codon:yes stop_codon:yes gene_type:complete